MVYRVRGRVLAILHDHPELQELTVQLAQGSPPERAYNFPRLYRSVAVGDAVWLNTAAVELGLGTGGRHFVIPEDWETGTEPVPPPAVPAANGHIMKLRYTPWQFPILAAEEPVSPLHQALQNPPDLLGIPVVLAPLHSMLPGIILGFRQQAGQAMRIAYIMTDAAALPLALSNLVRELKKRDLLDLTITSGQAFGGELEAISLPSALLVARQAIKADLIIVAQGPGNVGSDTPFGFSGIEQSWVIDLAAYFGGVPIVVPRISSADLRARHYGLSHHTTTILKLANRSALVGLSSLLPEPLRQQILEQFTLPELSSKHRLLEVPDQPAAELFDEQHLAVQTMGRSLDQDPWFFQSSVTAGFLAGLVHQNQWQSLNQLTR